MLKVFATDVVISKGFDNTSAIRFTETENGGTIARFRFGKKVYDPQAQDNARWINMTVKAFGATCERIKKMKLKEGSFVNLLGRLDEDVWTDKETGEKKSMMVVVLDDIEYAAGGGSKAKDKDEPKNGKSNAETAAQAPVSAPQDSENFTGYEPFSGGSFFDEN